MTLLAHRKRAGVNDEQGASGFAFPDNGGAGIETALGQHGDQQIEACIGEPTEERCGKQEGFQIKRADDHLRIIRWRQQTGHARRDDRDKKIPDALGGRELKDPSNLLIISRW